MIVGGVVIQGNYFLVQTNYDVNNRIQVQLLDLETNEMVLQNDFFSFIALNEVAFSDFEVLLALEESGYVLTNNKKIDVNSTTYRVATWI